MDTDDATTTTTTQDNTENQQEKEKELIAEGIYYNVNHPASYGGRERLYNAMRKHGWDRKATQHFLEKQNTYLLQKEKKSRFPRNKIITYHKDYQHQADLIDMREYSRDNDGYNYIIVIIDCFTRFCWLKAIKKKDANSMVDAFEQIYSRLAPVPLRLQTDRGTEFMCKPMLKWYKQHDIHYFTTQGVGFKCAFVERLNRTLKYRLFRYFIRQGSHRYIDILDQLAHSYNTSVHRTIGMTPQQARTVLPNALPVNFTQARVRKPTLQVDEDVRIAYDKGKMDRGYWKTFSDATYKVKRIFNNKEIPVYELEDYFKKKLPRRFYGRELARTGDIPYHIAKIHARRRRGGREEIQVSWLGYPSSYRDWIDAESADAPI